MIDIYGGQDPREIPTYTISTAARYLNISDSTIRSWTAGRKYPVSDGSRDFVPLIEVKQKKPLRMTFTNLIEIHVLRSIRKEHQVKLAKIRKALDYLSKEIKIAHPLAHKQFQTDGLDLFVEFYGDLINVSEQSKVNLKDSFRMHLERIEPDESGLGIALYPFTRSHEENNPRLVVIDPRISFGRLTIAGTGIPTDIIIERFRAGDSLQTIADDYECDCEKIEEAIRCETPSFAA